MRGADIGFFERPGRRRDFPSFDPSQLKLLPGTFSITDRSLKSIDSWPEQVGVGAAARRHRLLSLQRGLDYGRKEFSAAGTVCV
jgi:hypothetical protein